MKITKEIKAILTKEHIVKYLVVGTAVGLAAYTIPNRKSRIQEVFVISLVASLSFLLIDLLTVEKK